MGKIQVLRDTRGRTILERRNLPRDHGSSLVNDGYHWLRSASWTALLLMFAAVYVGTNLLFATILWGAHANVTTATGFADYFWFSVQSLATIGYGVLAPADALSNTIVTIESFLGFLLTALITGVVFARFATPSARVMFSKNVLIHQHGDQRHLTFRLANARVTAVVEATVHVYLTRDEVLHGERLRRIYELPLRVRVQPNFSLSWSVVHVIDEKSPLHGVKSGDLDGKGNILVTMQGIDDRLAATVHARWSYQPEDILFDRKFVDIIGADADGTRYLDFAFFDESQPVAPATSSGGQP